MRGPGPQTAPETPLCLPTSPLFKTKTKSPTPPSALQHPRPWGRTDGGRRTLHMPAVRGVSARRFLVSQPGWENQASPRKLRKYLWEYIKIRHKQLLVWGINSPARAPGPFKKSLCPKNLECLAKGSESRRYSCRPLHKERSCRAETGLCVQPALGQRQAEAGRRPWLPRPASTPTREGVLRGRGREPGSPSALSSETRYQG